MSSTPCLLSTTSTSCNGNTQTEFKRYNIELTRSSRVPSELMRSSLYLSTVTNTLCELVIDCYTIPVLSILDRWSSLIDLQSYREEIQCSTLPTHYLTSAILSILLPVSSLQLLHCNTCSLEFLSSSRDRPSSVNCVE